MSGLSLATRGYITTVDKARSISTRGYVEGQTASTDYCPVKLSVGAEDTTISIGDEGSTIKVLDSDGAIIKKVC